MHLRIVILFKYLIEDLVQNLVCVAFALILDCCLFIVIKNQVRRGLFALHDFHWRGSSILVDIQVREFQFLILFGLRQILIITRVLIRSELSPSIQIFYRLVMALAMVLFLLHLSVGQGVYNWDLGRGFAHFFGCGVWSSNLADYSSFLFDRVVLKIVWVFISLCAQR